MPEIDYSILGPLVVRLRPDGPPVPLREKAGLLLGRLLLGRGQAVSLTELAEDIWGDAAELENYKDSLQGLVRDLRRRLQDTDEPRRVIRHASETYRIVADPLQVDAQRFELLTQHAEALLDRRPRAALAMLDEGLAAWRGPLLGEHHGLTWIDIAERELISLRIAAEVRRSRALLALDRADMAELLLRRQIAEYPDSRRLRAQLVRLLAAVDRTPEARDACREALALGTPTDDLRRLADLLERGEPMATPRRRVGTVEGWLPDSVILHAILSDRERAAGDAGMGTLTLLVAREGGDPHPRDDRQLVAAFDDAAGAMRAARAAAADQRLRCRVGLHVGAIVRGGDVLAGAGAARCRLLAETAREGEVRVSADARDRHWTAYGLRNLGEGRYEDLLPAEPVFAVAGDDGAADEPPPKRQRRAFDHLPVQRTRLVGRVAELSAYSRFVVPGALVTLRGVGGCGKTRLALELAARRAGDFTDGAWFAGFAELEVGSGVEALALAVAGRLGARTVPDEAAATTLQRYLEDRRLLLVVDNCEHVAGAAAELVATLQPVSPGSCIVATSRKALGVAGERVIDVPAMSAAPDDATHGLSEAVELLLERATVLPGLAEGAAQPLEEATRICTMLDGIPLAIELAAAHVPTRGLAAVGRAVEEVLSGEGDLSEFASGDPERIPRQRTIEATVRWSHDLLDARERAVLHRLSVFNGSFGLAEARVVAAGGDLDEAAAGQTIERLIDWSMLTVEPPLGRVRRLRMLEQIRVYAAARLDDDGATRSARHAHAQVYTALAVSVTPTLFGPGEQAGLARLDADYENFRAALGWHIGERRADEAMQLVGALWWKWFAHGHYEDGGMWVARALSLGSSPSRARVRALRAASHLAWWRGRYDLCDEHNLRLEECARAIDDAWGLAWAPMGQGAVRMFREPQAALALLQRSRERFEALGAAWEAAYAVHVTGGVHIFAGDIDSARAAYEESVSVFERISHGSVLASARRGAGVTMALTGDRVRGTALCREALAFTESIGDPAGSAQALNFLAAISHRHGDLAVAAARYGDALEKAHEVGELWATCAALDGIAAIAWATGELEVAARLHARSDKLAERGGYRRPPHERHLRESGDHAVREGLGDVRCEEARVDGEFMSLSAAVTCALAFARGIAPGAPALGKNLP
jgi:predicted ATPase/DNA-binding SARP family transcriptional activator